MESKAKLLGHPIHPMLIVLPLGLFITACVFDIMYMATDRLRWTEVAFYMIGAGIIGGLLAAFFGVVDWLAIPSGTRAKAVGLYHGAGNVVVVVLFAISWYLRYPHPATPPTSALVLSFLGVAMGAVAGWLGGELVNRLAVGVAPGAHLNSPSSLTGRPASERSEHGAAGLGKYGDRIGRPM